MLELGGDFDDDLFGETRDRKQKEILVSYNAKICEPEWFNEADTSECRGGDEEAHNIRKFRADLHYRRRDYMKAATQYKACLETVAESNTAIRRGVYDSITRCYLHQNQIPEAIKYLQLLEDIAKNFEHKTSLFALQSKVFAKAKRHQERIEVVQKNITLHSSSPHLWLDLADTYLRSSIQHTTEESQGSGVQATSPPAEDPSTLYSPLQNLCIDAEAEFSLLLKDGDLTDDVTSTDMSLHLVLCTCLVRARSLLQSVQRNIVSFALEHNKRKIQQVQNMIDRLAVPTEALEKCIEHVNIDVFGLESLYKSDTATTDGSQPQTTTANAGIQGQTPVDQLLEGWSVENFEKSWFSWHKSNIKLNRNSTSS